MKNNIKKNKALKRCLNKLSILLSITIEFQIIVYKKPNLIFYKIIDLGTKKSFSNLTL